MEPFFSNMIDGFRYGFFGQSDKPVLISFIIMTAFALVISSAEHCVVEKRVQA